MVQGEGLSSSPFAVTQFAMWVDGDGQPGHYFTQLHSGGRRDDLNVPDIGSWRRQYPEFDFLLPQMDDWRRTDRKVLICDASIKVMTEVRSNVYLHIDFNLQSYVDLSGFESFVCTTRFFDSGDISPDPQFDYGRHDMKDSKKLKDLKEHRADCAYEADASGSRLRVPFGSLFWGNRIAKYQTFRHKDENRVRDSLLRLTATQDIYGILPDTGEAQCLLTILWRFQQTNNSAGAGDMKWRTASFANFRTVAEPKWIQEEEYKLTAMGDAEGGDEEAREDPVTVPDDMSLYHQVPQFPLDYSHGAAHPSHHPYEVRPHHQHHPLPLSLDILTSMQPDLDHNDASAPTTATDYSHQSFARSQQHDNDFDFTGGQINISGTFEPSINISAYDGFASQSTALDGLHALTGTGLEPDGFAGFGLALGENGQLINVESSNELPNQVDLACYSTKPNWNPGNVIPQLENAAAQYHPYLGHNDSQATHGHDGFHGPHTYSQGGDLVTHGLPDPNININPALWALQSPFHEDTGSGAINRTNCRKEQAHGLGFGVLDLIERDQRARGY
jgi:transcriptional enhancer factor